MQRGYCYRRDREATSSDGSSTSYFRESVVVFSSRPLAQAVPPAPAAGAGSATAVVAALLLGGWAGVAARLASRFGDTRYRESQRWPMALAWPLLTASPRSVRHAAPHDKWCKKRVRIIRLEIRIPAAASARRFARRSGTAAPRLQRVLGEQSGREGQGEDQSSGRHRPRGGGAARTASD